MSTQGGVERAVRAELRRLGFPVSSDALAALAASLARSIDSARGAVAAAAAAAQLRAVLADLAAVAAEKVPEADPVGDLRDDELAARRAAAG